MELLEIICEKIGVEIGEIFKMKPTGEDEQSFRLDKIYGLEVYNKSAEIWVSAGNHIYSDFITGRLKTVWKPEQGEGYYYPRTDLMKGWEGIHWADSSTDNHRLNNNLVFKTKEEAIACAEKMLQAIKEEKQ